MKLLIQFGTDAELIETIQEVKKGKVPKDIPKIYGDLLKMYCIMTILITYN